MSKNNTYYINMINICQLKLMAGVDLNTVRELLRHTDLSRTLRYVHLALLSIGLTQ